jgi:hypothetical protein
MSQMGRYCRKSHFERDLAPLGGLITAFNSALTVFFPWRHPDRVADPLTQLTRGRAPVAVRVTAAPLF